MKKHKNLLLVLLPMMLIVFLLFSPQLVTAKADDAWLLPDFDQAAAPLNIDAAAKTAPAWMQQFSEGIQIETPTKICAPFREGQFRWVPLILQLKEGKWGAVQTTLERLDSPEGRLYACATPKSSGTFALFGYYDGPSEPWAMTDVPATATFTPTASEEPTEEPTDTEEPLVCPPGWVRVGDICQPAPGK